MERLMLTAAVPCCSDVSDRLVDAVLEQFIDQMNGAEDLSFLKDSSSVSMSPTVIAGPVLAAVPQRVANNLGKIRANAEKGTVETRFVAAHKVSTLRSNNVRRSPRDLSGRSKCLDREAGQELNCGRTGRNFAICALAGDCPSGVGSARWCGGSRLRVRARRVRLWWIFPFRFQGVQQLAASRSSVIRLAAVALSESTPSAS